MSTPTQARRFCADQLLSVLGQGPSARAVADDATVVVSELVTNAVRAGCANVVVDVHIHHRWLRVLVADQAPGLPQAQHPGPEAESGRGLMMVGELADQWGVELCDPGKQVWADLSLPPDLTADIHCAM